MMKMNKFEELLKCRICLGTFKKPVLLPCYETICKNDLIYVDNEKTTVRCPFCPDEHFEPINGFPIDKRTQNFIDLYFDQLVHGNAYKNGKKCITDLNSKFKEVDMLEKDPLNYIFEYFLDIRTKVDIRREELKSEIDAHSDKLIEDLKIYENDCKLCLDKVIEISKDLGVSRKILAELSAQFDNFDMTEKKLTELNQKSEDLTRTVNNQINNFKKAILKNMSYEFKPVSVHVENIFGTIKCKEEDSLADSNILSESDTNTLIDMCKSLSDKQQNWKLIYRAKRDGFAAEDFHQRCDGRRQTLTIIKTSNSFVFGGYTEADWAQNQPDGHFKFDQNAFIFSLINKTNQPLVVRCTEPSKAIFCAENYGPIFGNWPHDIVIDTNSNLYFENYCNLSFSYKYYENGADFFLAGDSCDFKTDDIEVFALD